MATNPDEAICGSVESFAQICMEGEGNVEGWREEAKCEKDCGPDMTFNYTASPCPDVCGNPQASLTCPFREYDTANPCDIQPV